MSTFKVGDVIARQRKTGDVEIDEIAAIDALFCLTKNRRLQDVGEGLLRDAKTGEEWQALCPRPMRKSPNLVFSNLPIKDLQIRRGALGLSMQDEPVLRLEADAHDWLSAAAENDNFIPRLWEFWQAGNGPSAEILFEYLKEMPDTAHDLLALLLTGDGPADFAEKREVLISEIAQEKPGVFLDKIETGYLLKYLEIGD